jgi:hypothetical protein
MVGKNRRFGPALGGVIAAALLLCSGIAGVVPLPGPGGLSSTGPAPHPPAPGFGSGRSGSDPHRAGIPLPCITLVAPDAVTFTEVGLWNSTVLTIDLNGSIQTTTIANASGASVTFCTVAGTYPYCVSLTGSCTLPADPTLCTLSPVPVRTGSYYVRPPCGAVTTSNTSAGLVNVTFTSAVAPCAPTGPGGVPNPIPTDFYEVNFTEANLPYGSPWWVDAPGLPPPELGWNATTSGVAFAFVGQSGPTICLRFAVGTYAYTVGTSNPMWTAKGGSFVLRGPLTRPAEIVCGEPEGSVLVNGASVTVTVTFSLLIFEVTFDASGLPGGEAWWINITGGDLAATLSLESTGPNVTARLVNASYYNFTAGSSDARYDWPHAAMPLHVSGANLTVNVTFVAVTYPIQFNEQNLPRTGITWYVNLTGEPSLSATTSASGGTSVSVNLTNGTYSYSAAAANYSAPAGTFRVDGPIAPLLIPVNFTFVGRLNFTPPIYSSLIGPFLGDGAVSLSDTFGVATSFGSYPAGAEWVNGTINGTSVSFTSRGGGLFTGAVDVGSLRPGAVLSVVATYRAGGPFAIASYPIWVVAPPAWLQSFLSWTGGGVLTVPGAPASPWNNSYTLRLEGNFSLSSEFNVNLPLAGFTGGGSYQLLPSAELSLVLASGGALTMGAQFAFATPEIDVGVAAVQMSASVGAYGTFALGNGSIVWESAELWVNVSGSVSFNVPIYGYTFDVPDLGSVTIGLSATITVSPSVAVALTLLPSSAPSDDLIPGLGVTLSDITAAIGTSLSLALNAGVGVASIDGAGTIGVTLYLGPSKPYVEGGTVTGGVSIGYQVLYWSGTLWSVSGTLYSWGTDPPTSGGGSGGAGSPADARPSAGLGNNSTTYAPIPRYYYNVSNASTLDYGELTWTAGASDGVAIRNVYPFATLTAAGGASSALLLYGSDNVSKPVDEGLSVQGLAYNVTTGTVRTVNVTLPGISNEVQLDPELLELPNGTDAVLWNAIPYANTTSALNPFNLTSSTLQLAYYHPDAPAADAWTPSGGPIDLSASPGFSQSFSADFGPSGLSVLDQVGPAALSNDSTLEVILVGHGPSSETAVADQSRVLAYRAASSLAIVEYDNGTYALLNVSSGGRINATAGLDCPVVQMSFVEGSNDEVVALLAGIPNDTLVLTTPGAGPTVLSLPRNVSTLTAVAYGSAVALALSGPFGVEVDLVQPPDVIPLTALPWENTEHLAVALVGSDLVLFGTQGWGSFRYAWEGPGGGNESFSFSQLSIAKVSLLTYPVTFVESGLATGTAWSVVLNGSAGSSANSTISLPAPSGRLPFRVGSVTGYAVNRSGGFVAVSGAGARVPLQFRPAAGLYAVNFTESGLPAGTTWSVTLNGTTESTNASWILFYAGNGSATYSVGGVTGYSANPAGSVLSISGAPVAQAISFRANPAPGLLGLPGNTGYYLLGGAGVLLVAAASTAYYLHRRPKTGNPPSAPSP